MSELENTDLLDTLLAEVNQQLSAKGLYIKTGEASIVDATVIEARQSRPRKGKDGGNAQDGEAEYNGKKASTYGYKAHANVDGDGFIKAVDYTPGNEHDSVPGKTTDLHRRTGVCRQGLRQQRTWQAPSQAQPTAERPAKTPKPPVVKRPQHRRARVRASSTFA